MRSIDSIFSDRTCYKFLDKPVSKEILVKIYDLMKMGATSANACPLRIVFVSSSLEKEKLYVKQLRKLTLLRLNLHQLLLYLLMT